MAIPRSSQDGLVITQNVQRGLPRNSSVLSRSINIVVNGKVIGYIQSFKPTEGRIVNKTWELGNEDIVELVPGGMDTNEIIVQRVLLYQSRLVEVLDSKNGEQGNDLQSYPLSIMDYNYPFDIYVYLHRLKDRERSAEVETLLFEAYIKCWFTKYGYEVKAEENFRIFEEATIQYTYKTGTSLLRK